MDEKTITLDNVNENEGIILTLMVDGTNLIKLRAYQKFLQGQLNEEGMNHEVSLSETIMYIVVNELEESVSFS
jgi:hypothetical protein